MTSYREPSVNCFSDQGNALTYTTEKSSGTTEPPDGWTCGQSSVSRGPCSAASRLLSGRAAAVRASFPQGPTQRGEALRSGVPPEPRTQSFSLAHTLTQAAGTCPEITRL